MNTKTRILFADDHDVVRSGLRLLLRSSAKYSIVAEAGDGEEAVRLAERYKPDVAILDISMPKLDGIGATRAIKQKLPSTGIVILTVHEDEEYVYQILRAGASGYVLKNSGKKEIFAAVDAARKGERFFSPGISSVIIEGFIRGEREAASAATRTDPDQHAILTKRELEVLRHIAEGRTNREIADLLFLSFNTINSHRSNIMQKLDIHDTAGLVRYAIGQGLISPEGSQRSQP
jgi:NarL family two-component system response regulator LiaR